MAKTTFEDAGAGGCIDAQPSGALARDHGTARSVATTAIEDVDVVRLAPYRQSRTILAAACAVSAASGLLLNVMPALLSAAASRFSLTATQVGVVGSSFLAGFALVTATSNQWIARFNWRAVAACGAAVSVAGVAGCAFVRSYASLVAVLTAAGFGMGLIATVSTAVVAENHQPDQAFGIKLAGDVFLAVVALIALTAFTTRWGFPGIALTLAAILGLALLCGLPGIPPHRAIAPPAERLEPVRRLEGKVSFVRDWAQWIGLAALFISISGLSALWAFLSQIAPSFGVNGQTAATALTAGLVGSGLAGLAAAAVGDRFGRVKPLSAGIALVTLGIASLQWGHDEVAYIAGVLLFVGIWNFPLAYQMGMIASSDPDGRAAVLMPAAVAIGSAVGPVLGGVMLSNGHGYRPLYAFSTLASAVSLGLFILLGRRLRAVGGMPERNN